jgi:3alpha(or 20beta)-hydroxysteroid dehydrogenase
VLARAGYRDGPWTSPLACGIKAGMSHTFNFNNKNALITGGASGIGAAVARQIAAGGGRVVVADVDRAGAERGAAGLGGDARALGIDVRSEEEWASAAGFVAAELGALHLLVNCAGVVRMTPLVDQTEADYRLQLEVNAMGTFLAMRACAPLIGSSGGGAIVNVSSINALRGYADSVGYASSKAAVLAMTKTAANELSALGIRVNAVQPGIIDTPMQGVTPPEVQPVIDHLLRIPGRMGTADEVANAITFLLSDLSRYVTGAELLIDGGVMLGG